MRMTLKNNDDPKVRANSIIKLILKYKAEPIIRKLAIEITKHCKKRDYLCEVYSIYDFVINNIRYIHDIEGVDTYQSPIRTIELQAGDCDDHTILIASLLQSIGYPVVIKIISQDGETYNHIYPIALTPDLKKMYIVDTTGNKGFNKEPSNIKDAMLYLIYDDEVKKL